MLAALQFSRSKPRQAVIAGDPQQQATRLLVHGILRDFHPDLVVLYAEDASALSGDAAEALDAMQPREGLLSTSAKTLPAARLSLRRRTRAGWIALRRRIWIEIFDSGFCPGSAAGAKRLLLRQQFIGFLQLGFLQLGGAGVVRFLRLNHQLLQVLLGYVLLAGLRGCHSGAVRGVEATREMPSAWPRTRSAPRRSCPGRGASRREARGPGASCPARPGSCRWRPGGWRPP